MSKTYQNKSFGRLIPITLLGLSLLFVPGQALPASAIEPPEEITLTAATDPEGGAVTPTELEPPASGALSAPTIPEAGADWPQAQRTPQRTGYTTETLGTNFRVAWTRPFQPEKVYPQVQAIVYGGKVFVGTEMGKLYALNATTGAQQWVFDAGGSILASAAAANGRVYFGAMDGAVYAVDANAGTQAWKSALLWRHGFSTAPVIADNKLMLGGRDGVFYALDLNDGHVIWQYSVGAPILQSAAWNNGRVFFGAMDLYVYAINTSNGSLAWKSQKTNSMAIKDYWPVVTAGKVLVRTMAEVPEQKHLYSFNESTGSQAISLPQFDGWTMNGTTTPPCIDRNGYLIVPALRSPDQYPNGWGQLDANTGQIVDVFDDGTNKGFASQDETVNVSCSNNLIIAFHTVENRIGSAGYNGIFNLNTWQWTTIPFGHTSAQMMVGGGGGGGSPASISNGMIYHISIHELIARATQ